MMFPLNSLFGARPAGAERCFGDSTLIAACSGFIYGLTTAANLVIAGAHDRILVIGADTMSRITDYKDRATCILFGDGARAP